MKLGTTVALAALLIWQFAWLRADIRDLRADIEALSTEVGAEIGAELRKSG
ncbi:MAG: hypothetical protein OXG51_06130 [Gammaproteobacteria bacterium]|nr:hypothetical protein [Gammaproteobacteria bacterium]